MVSPTQVRGGGGEERAAEFLVAQGLQVLSRNYRTRLGEIDLIARDGDVLVFVEVRLRAGRGFGGAAESVTPHKQRRIQSAAQMYLRQLRREPRCRFDVIAVEDNAVSWIKAAFEAA